ncbi:MAG TPA: hypothetical protein VGL92_09270, partial [Acidimicrobiia bacterium]
MRGRRALAATAGIGVLIGVLMATFAGPATAFPALPAGQLEQFRDVTGVWTTGSLGSSNSAYSEAEAVPFRIQIPDTVVAGNYTITVCRDFQDGTTFGYLFLEPFNSDRNPPLAPATVTTNSNGPFTGAKVAAGDTVTIGTVTETGGQGSCVAGARETLVDVTLAGNAGDKYVLFGGHLAAAGEQIPGAPAGTLVQPGSSAAFFSGASLSMRLSNMNRAINPDAIVQLGQITVQKVVDTGSATPDQFCFSINPNPNGVSLPQCPAAGTDTVTFLALGTGNYTITETTVPPGYTFASGSGTNCAFNGSTATAAVTAAVDPVNATCVFHNRLLAGTLTVTKIVTNDSGGSAVVGDFPLFVNGNPVTSGVANSLPAGPYTVSETGLAGYTGTIGGACAANGTVVLGDGQNLTCTITNDDNPATLTVTKIVTNNSGGTAVVGDFPLFVDGGSVTSGAANQFNAGLHTVSETGLAGYTGTIGGDCAADGTITLSLGQVANCTITNDDNPATLTVTKIVTNNSGGTAVVGDFPLFVNGNPVTSGVANALAAGGYTVSETGLAGYTGTIGGDCAADGTITLSLGQVANCTITNNDDPATLTVIKNVVNNDGGNAVPGDFTINVTGTDVSDPSFPGVSGAGTTVTLDAGPYAVTEGPPAGYTASFSADCAGTLAPGETRTCTVTNDDLAPEPRTGTIIVRKVADEYDTDQEFPFSSNFDGLLNDGVDFTLEAGEELAFDLEAGTFSVTELVPDGWNLVSAVCSDQSPVSAIVLAADETVTCT